MKCYILKSDYKITKSLTVPIGSVFVKKRNTIVHFFENTEKYIVFSDEILDDDDLFEEKEVQTL